MIDWRDIATEDIQILALIADRYGWSISRMLRHMNVLTIQERDAVCDILRPAQQMNVTQITQDTAHE